MKRRLACVIVGLVLLPAAAQAQDERPRIARIRVGFAGRYKLGLWTPVEVTVRGGTQRLTGQVALTVPDGDGMRSRVSTPGETCLVQPGGETTVTLYARFGRADGTAEVHFIVGRDVYARKIFETGLSADDNHFLSAVEAQRLVVWIGPVAASLDEPLPTDPESQRRTVVARLDSTEHLPARWYGYEGVDAVVLSTSRPEIYRTLTADGAQVNALDQWVRMGGKLVLCAGSEGDRVLAGNLPLARFAPGRFDRMVPLRQTGELQSFAGSSKPILLAAGGPGAAISAARLADVQGTVEAREADLPLVVRAPRGFGMVRFLAADLDRGPLGNWEDRRLLAARLLDIPTNREKDSDEDGPIMHYGYQDLAGQLRSAMDQFTGVRLVPFSLVALLVLIYILLIGPLDFLLLKKLGRMEWTWLTFPAIVLLVSLGAYFLAYYLKGDQLRMNQVDLVDIDLAAGHARGTTWVNVFSPRMEAFDLALRPCPPGQDKGETGDATAPAKAGQPDNAWPDGSIIAWFGLPGEGFGGMRGRHAAGPVIPGSAYDFRPGLEGMDGVPIQVWSTKSFTGRWSAPLAAPVLEADLARAADDKPPAGSLTNKLGLPLSNCVLAYGKWGYDLGTLEPGRPRSITGDDRGWIELKTLLTGRKMVFSQSKDAQEEVPTYDLSGRDMHGILQAMMFYEAMGGRRHMRLANDYQGFVDASGLLGAGRAILIARLPAEGGAALNGSLNAGRRGAELLNKGRSLSGPKDRHVTVYRFVLPVEKK